MTEQMSGHDADEQAAYWYARINAAQDPADKQRFQDWLDGAPANGEAWASLQRVNGKLDTVRSHPALAAMLAEAQADYRETAPRRRFGGMAIAASLAAILTIGGGALWLNRAPSPQTVETASVATRYATKVGERSTITLADGSRVMLDTDSAISVGQWATRRDVRLEKGQALFEVAHDAAHPFVVASGNRTVEALGTKFVVRMGADDFAVGLVEGKVRVSLGASTAATILAPGEKLALRGDLAAVSRGSADAMMAWTDGHLTFDRLPLREVVQEMNRYSPRKIVLSDDKLGERPFSGTFNVDGGDALVEALKAYGLARVVRSDETELVIAAK